MQGLRGNRGRTADTEKKDEKREPPEIGAPTFDRARFGYRDPTIKTDVATDLSTTPADQQNAGMWKVTGAAG